MSHENTIRVVTAEAQRQTKRAANVVSDWLAGNCTSRIPHKDIMLLVEVARAAAEHLGAPPEPRYRLLTRGEAMQIGDEYLKDDAQTWAPIQQTYFGEPWREALGNVRRSGTEPVAWMVYTQDGPSVYVTDNPRDITEGQRALPLYTAPQEAR